MTMRRVFSQLVFASLLLAATAGFAAVDGVVTATRLNVRVRPGTKYTRVAQLLKDAKVSVLRHKDDWYEIAAPADSEVWISSAFIDSKGSVLKLANLRSGPSVANSSYRLAKPGETLEIIRQSNGWTKVRPPKNLTAWVSAKFVYLTPENAAKLAKPKAEKPVAAKKPAVPQEKKQPTAVPNKKKPATLPFTESQVRIATYEGVLLPVSKVPYVTHAVAAKTNGENFPLCYVHSDVLNLKLWEKKRVSVTGNLRWVQGWKRPVLDIIKITPAH